MNSIISSLAKKNPKLIQALRYIKRFHRLPNLRNPKNIYEIMIGLSMDKDNMPVYGRLADKFLVREYVEERIGKEYLVPLLGHYSSPDDINFEELPDKFVLKTTNGCGTNIIVKDKNIIDSREIKERLRTWLSKPFGIKSGEPHYLLINPTIVAESFLEEKHSTLKGLTDYKFYCIKGKSQYMLLCANRVFDGHTHRYDTMIYDMEWNACPQYLKEKCQTIEIEKPNSFELLRDLVSKLADGFDFVRVDFYVIDGKPLFGEMTFTPGFDMENLSFMERLGSMLKL